MSIELKDCKKCVHVKSEANPEYYGSCEFCFRRNGLADFYTEPEKDLSNKKKCPMYNQGICEKGIIPMCKFNIELCFVEPLVYSLFIREKRERD